MAFSVLNEEMLLYFSNWLYPVNTVAGMQLLLGLYS